MRRATIRNDLFLGFVVTTVWMPPHQASASWQGPRRGKGKPKNLQEIEAGKVPIYGAKVVPIRIVISPWGLTCDIFRPCEAKKSKLVKIGGRKARLN